MKKEARRLQIIITVTALTLAIVHIIYPNISIDAVTTALFFIAVAPWLYPLFKSVELPGGVKFEFQDLENIMERAKRNGLVEFRGGGGHPYLEEFSFLYAAKNNEMNLAFSGLRLEIEKKLYELAMNYDLLDAIPYEISIKTDDLLDRLSDVKALSMNESLIIKKLMQILNAGSHESISDDRAMEIIMSDGPGVIWALETRIMQSMRG